MHRRSPDRPARRSGRGPAQAHRRHPHRRRRGLRADRARRARREPGRNEEPGARAVTVPDADPAPHARDDRRGLRARPRRLRERREDPFRGRVRRRRGAPRPQLSAQLVPQPEAQQAAGRVGWVAREPIAVPTRGRARRARGSRCRCRGHRQAQHGRRGSRRLRARGVARVREDAPGRRDARRAAADRGLVARESDVPVPRRRAAEGVRRDASAADAARLQDRRAAVLQVVPVRGGLLVAARAPLQGRARPPDHPARRHQQARDDPLGARRGLRVRRDGSRVARATRGWSTRCRRGRGSSRAAIHCNKCMPTIYTGTRCLLP